MRRWYASAIPHGERLKGLMNRSDGPFIRDTIIWVAAFLGHGRRWIWLLWGSWWAVPPSSAYGVLYGSSTDSRWHECGHGTAFKTRWMKMRVVYQIACFMVLREPTVWRWGHTRHHTRTRLSLAAIQKVVAPRPPICATFSWLFFGIKQAQSYISKVTLHSIGKLTTDEETFIPQSRAGQRSTGWRASISLSTSSSSAGPYIFEASCRTFASAHVCRLAVALWCLALRRYGADAAPWAR